MAKKAPNPVKPRIPAAIPAIAKSDLPGNLLLNQELDEIRYDYYVRPLPLLLKGKAFTELAQSILPAIATVDKAPTIIFSFFIFV